jgi:hypothetical protein
MHVQNKGIFIIIFVYLIVLLFGIQKQHKFIWILVYTV